MPGLSRRGLHTQPLSSSYNGSVYGGDAQSSLWARSNTGDVSFSQLHKFWSALSPTARRELLRIDKQALFEQVRKNLYCSRCHGLLVEGFSQIVMYGKSLYADGRKLNSNNSDGHVLSIHDDVRDPSLHPWGGLAATRDSMLTVLDCFLDGTPLEVLQNVFESARARERERELLYPDACGGGGRGWMSQNGRGHGMKETCALHTARLSCEALVDFWSALGEETRRSLLRMKEEDFIERLTFRFDSKRFCRDCRRNVLREFKEMKELKRTRREPRCTPWFCAADTVFQYEVSDTVVQADWRESFAGEIGTIYQHFEWGLGTGEGKADIFGFEDVGLAENIMLGGLDLANYPDCFITIRAWRRDGRCTELSAKAHGLKGQLCVHRRLFVGDGLVSITEGESIERFFEHAEETEEEEDEEAMDKEGNELESGTSRTQKHAKSPELARDFLLDAATVIFKEQVEKAFREGTARQNAHSIFVCLALGLLEDRVRVACKEIATLEKQNKLLEEEEYQKREEEERRERKKLKEREKKLRRKEKRNKDKKEIVKGDGKSAEDLANAWTDSSAVSSILDEPQASCENHIMEDEHPCVQMEDSCRNDDSLSARSSTTGFDSEVNAVEGTMTPSASSAEDDPSNKDVSGKFLIEQSKSAKRRSQSKRLQADPFPSRHSRRGSNMAYERSFRRSSTRVIPNHYSESSWQEPNLQCHRNFRILRDGNSRLPDNRHRLNCHSQLRHDSQQCSCPQVLSRTKNMQNTVFKPARDCNPKIIKRTANGDSCVKQYFVVSNSNYKGDFYRGKKSPAFGSEKHPHMKAKGDLSGPSPRINPKLVSCNQDAGHSIDMEDSTESNASTCIARSNCVSGNVREDIAKDIGECIEQNGQFASADNLPLELNGAGVTVSSSGDASANASLVEDCSSFTGSPESSFRSSISEDLECVSSVQESVVSSIHASRPGSPAVELSSCSTAMADAQCVEDDGRNDAKNPAAMSEKVECMEGIPPGRVQGTATYPQLVHDTFSDFPQGIKSGYSVPTQPQLSHSASASTVHSLPLQFPQPSYGCYSWTAQPRANIIIPPQIFIPGPSSMALPRYGMLPLPPVVRPVPSLSNAVTSLHIREPLPLHFSKWKSSADAQPFVSSGASTGSLQPAPIRTDSQTAPLSMPDKTDFSLFHFGGPRSTVLTQSGYLPALPDSTESAGSSCSSDLSKCKCADELPSGINAISTSAGEYSLFAAAPGKGFGFF